MGAKVGADDAGAAEAAGAALTALDVLAVLDEAGELELTDV